MPTTTQSRTQRYAFQEVPGVFITGMNGVHIEKDEELGTFIAFEKIDALEREIAVALCLRERPLTGMELRFLRMVFNTPQNALGIHFGYKDGQSIANWEKKNDKITLSRQLKEYFLAKNGMKDTVFRVILDQEGMPDPDTIEMTFDTATSNWSSNVRRMMNLSEPHYVMPSITNTKAKQRPVLHLVGDTTYRVNMTKNILGMNIAEEDTTSGMLHLLTVAEYVNNEHNGHHGR